MSKEMDQAEYYARTHPHRVADTDFITSPEDGLDGLRTRRQELEQALIRIDEILAPKIPRTDPHQIAVMPSRALLEEYLRGSSGPTTVCFNLATGRFERNEKP